MLSGLLSLLILIADIWAILNVVKSNETTGTKIVWVLVIFFLPILGLAIWYFAGPRGS